MPLTSITQKSLYPFFTENVKVLYFKSEINQDCTNHKQETSSNKFLKFFSVLFSTTFTFILKLWKHNCKSLLSLCYILHTGTSLSQNKDPGGLLLLRVGAPRTSPGPCTLLCWNGAQHDQNYQVMLFFSFVVFFFLFHCFWQCPELLIWECYY